MWNISIWPIDRTLTGTTTLGQSEPESNGNEEVLCIPQSSSITGTSTSDCLVPYRGHSWGRGGSYLSAEIQSEYSTAPADWAVTLYEFELGHNAMEATKIICCVTGEGGVDHSSVIGEFKKFCLGCKKFDNQVGLKL